MRIFWTARSYRRAIRAELRQLPDASDLLVRYSENQTLLRSAVAAQLGVGTRFVIDHSMLLAPMSRALCAFAVGLRKERDPDEHREADAKT